MAYNKINWTENTPITADRLNQMETGIADASRDIANCLPLTGGTITGDLTCNQYLNINAWSGYGTGAAKIWYDATATNNRMLRMTNVDAIRLANGEVYSSGGLKPTPADIGALPLSGGTLTNTLYMQTSGQTKRRIASIANHGGTNIADSNTKTVIQSNVVPIWWNGSASRAMLVFDKENPSDYIVRCGAGLSGAAGYITFTW